MSRVVAILALGCVAARADAQCAYTDLTSAVPDSVLATPAFDRYNQTHSYWAVIGIRSAASTNWDLDLFQSTAVSPTCASGLLATSNAASGVDLVVTDCNAGRSPLGLYYPRATRTAGTGRALLEWDAGANALTVNGPVVQRTTDAADVLEIWDVYLNAGTAYSFSMSATGATVKLLLFRNKTGGAYSARRSTAEFETATTVTYTPPASGFYGVVAVNDNGATGSYALRVRTCETPTPLTSGVAVTTPLADAYYSFHQVSSYWTAVGVRGTSNWQLELDRNLGSGSYPSCLSGVLASSLLPAPTVDVVAGNFSNEFLGTYYARVSLDQALGSGLGTVEWDGGPDELPVDGAMVSRTTGPGDVLEAWDVYLLAGQKVTIGFVPTTDSLTLLLFRDTGNAWFPRAGAVLQTNRSQQYQAPAEGTYGVVVVNENGEACSYTLRISTGVLGVDDPVVHRTELIGIQPNPARARAAFAYSLAAPGSVAFEVLDVSGRLAYRTPATARGAGRWAVTWRGENDAGAPLRPGLYFVRMLVDGRTIANRKFTLLR